MMRSNKGKLLLSSIVILLPVFAGLLLWKRLPELIPTHWGLDGTANGWSGKGFAVFGLPLMLLAIHWLCVLITARDPGNRNQNRKVYGLVLWMIPVVSVFTGGIVYAVALGREMAAELWTVLLIGLLFLVIGNYMPKSRQNRTIGIRIKWTLESEENWNATHRMAGKLWVAGGLVCIASAFLPESGWLWAIAVVVPVMVLIPVIYSFRFHQKQVREGTAPTATKGRNPAEKKALGISLLMSVLVMAGCAFLCFTGNVEVICGETAFTVKASYYRDLTVEYEAVDGVELCEQIPAGRRQFGFGSPRLSMGQFKNEAYGAYTRYAYTKCDASVVLQVGEEILVISGPDAERTQAIYQELMKRCA